MQFKCKRFITDYGQNYNHNEIKDFTAQNENAFDLSIAKYKEHVNKTTFFLKLFIHIDLIHKKSYITLR